jgi:glycosyltransferase involved in cell wall biosynthesis
MKVAILLTELTTPGGAPRQAMLLGQWLQKLGHEATLYAVRYCPENCYPEIAATLDVRAVERLSLKEVRNRLPRRHHGLLQGIKRHFWESRQLAKLVHEPCDILNPHVRGATRAAVACKPRMGAPVVWMCDDARNWEEPGYREYYAPPVQWVFDWWMARIEKPVVRQIDRTIALDTRVKKILEGFYGCAVEVIRSGLDAGAFTVRPEAREGIRGRLGIKSSDFLLLWLGIIEPHRRLEDAIEAVRLLRLQGRNEVHLLIAGAAAFAPEYARRLQELAARYKLQDCVHFHLSPIPENEMADTYSAADALVYLAENQCWGLGVFEAMACNLPVIVSRACGAQEVLTHGVTAMICAPRDPADLARRVVELLQAPDLRERLVQDARVRVMQQITWEAYARNMLRSFEQVLGEQKRGTAAGHREAFA